jgi:hypothetical protein
MEYRGILDGWMGCGQWQCVGITKWMDGGDIFGVFFDAKTTDSSPWSNSRAQILR